MKYASTPVKALNVEFVKTKEKDFLLKTFSNILLSNWTSYHLAIINKIDPLPVKMVEDFKNDLKD